jgi:hypothetical protein
VPCLHSKGGLQLISVFGRHAEMNTRLEAIIADLPRGSWVRAESVHYIRGGVALHFVVLRGRRGKAIARWRIVCRGVRELSVSELDGGGLQVYAANHPVAKQYSDRLATLRWRPRGRGGEAIGALLAAHTGLVDDWIPFERYTSSRLDAPLVVWKGPEFLMRAYARTLRDIGLLATVVAKQQQRRAFRPRCLHFGNSFVVTDHCEILSGAT